MASALRKWMRKEEVYDKDIETILEENGIAAPPDDFKNLTQKQWDEIVRKTKVERFKELKDQASRNRLEKKIKKLEKIWRGQSGIKSTSIKKGKKSDKKKKETNEASKKQKDALESNNSLKKWMQKNQVWEIELFMILTDEGICDGTKDLKEKITSNDDFDEVYRKVRVRRAKDLKDNDAKLRMEKLMTKFEKLWRKQSGVPKTSITKKSKTGDKKKTPKDKKNEELSGKGLKLKKWMQKNTIWEQMLYEALLTKGIEDPAALAQLSEEEFDDIVRGVRVERFKELKDQKARNRCDKLLVAFEKLWRAESGIKKTSIKDKE